MNRRNFLAVGTLSFFSRASLLGQGGNQKISPRPEIPPSYERWGDFYAEIRKQESGRKVNYLYLTLLPVHMRGKYYRTTALERLRATGLVEPNDPTSEFYPVGSELGGQPIFEIITINHRRLRGKFWFLLDEDLMIGGNVDAGSFLIKPTSRLSITLGLDEITRQPIPAEIL